MYCKWVRGYFIPGKVEQDENDTVGSGRDVQQKGGKTPKNIPDIVPGITGVLHQYL